MPNNAQVGIVRRFRAWEVRNVIHPTHGADSVPDPNKMRLTFAAKGLLKISGDSEVDLLLLNHPNRVRDQPLVVLAQQSDYVKHSAQGSCRVSSSTKTENVQGVT